MVGFIIFAILSLAAFIYPIYLNAAVLKGKKRDVNYPKLLIQEGIVSVGFAICFVAMLMFIYQWGNISPKGSEVFFAIFFASSA